MNEMAAIKISNRRTRKCRHQLEMYHIHDSRAKVSKELRLRSTKNGVRDILKGPVGRDDRRSRDPCRTAKKVGVVKGMM